MHRHETWRRPRDDNGNRAFMELPPDDYGHQLSPSFTYGRQHPAAAACADQHWNKAGRFDGSWEQAQSRDLDCGRSQRKKESGKRRRSESPRPRRDKNRDKETILAEASEAVGRAAPWNADAPQEQKMLADDRHRYHRGGLARSSERSGEEGARHAARTEQERDPRSILVRRGSGRDGVLDHGGPQAVGGAAPREAVERRAQITAGDRGRNHGPGHCERLAQSREPSREEGVRNTA